MHVTSKHTSTRAEDSHTVHHRTFVQAPSGMHSRITPTARVSHYEVGRQILLQLGCESTCDVHVLEVPIHVGFHLVELERTDNPILSRICV